MSENQKDFKVIMGFCVSQCANQWTITDLCGPVMCDISIVSETAPKTKPHLSYTRQNCFFLLTFSMDLALPLPAQSINVGKVWDVCMFLQCVDRRDCKTRIEMQ